MIAKQNSSGKLIAEALTQDHSPSNRAEFERLNREHPNEQQTVCFAPNSKSPLRVLGGMMPSRFTFTHLRCFGDGRYKWSLKDQEKIDALVSGIPLKSYSWVRPDYLFTPPYLTASPDTITRKISSNDAFIILGTGTFVRPLIVDGLFDTLDNQHCVDIVADWLEKKSSIQVDSNAATFLIRKAVQSGKDTAFLSRMLTLHPSISRQFRDDITVSIMFLNGFENN